VNSRCYVYFEKQSDALAFIKGYHGTSIVDERGLAYRAVCGMAPFQKAPKRIRKVEVTKDNLADTCGEDPYFLQFLKDIEDPAKAAQMHVEAPPEPEANDKNFKTPLVAEIEGWYNGPRHDDYGRRGERRGKKEESKSKRAKGRNLPDYFFIFLISDKAPAVVKKSESSKVVETKAVPKMVIKKPASKTETVPAVSVNKSQPAPKAPPPLTTPPKTSQAGQKGPQAAQKVQASSTATSAPPAPPKAPPAPVDPPRAALIAPTAPHTPPPPQNPPTQPAAAPVKKSSVKEVLSQAKRDSKEKINSTWDGWKDGNGNWHSGKNWNNNGRDWKSDEKGSNWKSDEKWKSDSNWKGYGRW
jgi:hypothetical protein